MGAGARRMGAEARQSAIAGSGDGRTAEAGGPPLPEARTELAAAALLPILPPSPLPSRPRSRVLVGLASLYFCRGRFVLIRIPFAELEVAAAEASGDTYSEVNTASVCLSSRGKTLSWQAPLTFPSRGANRWG